MKAIVYTQYGPPDVLKLVEVEKPAPKEDEVLVKVHASSVNAQDWHLMRADPFLVRLMAGLQRPKYPILGSDLAGQVEAVGGEVLSLNRGMRYSAMVVHPAYLLARLPSMHQFPKTDWR